MDEYYPRNYGDTDWRRNSLPSTSGQRRDDGNRFEGGPGLSSESFYTNSARSADLTEYAEYDNQPRIGDRSGPRTGGRESSDFDSVRPRDRHSRSPRQDDQYQNIREHGPSTSSDSWSESKRFRPREPGIGNSGESFDRKIQLSKSRDRSYSNDKDRDTDRRSRDLERKSYQDDYGYNDDRERRSRRRSRSRDRDHDRRRRESDRDRRHRDPDRERRRRDRDREREDKERSPKDIPWVPPPLPEHLRHLQVQMALTPTEQSEQSQPSSWVPPQVPSAPAIQNQFQNDGSFMAMFRQQMQASGSGTTQQPQASVPLPSVQLPAPPAVESDPPAPTLAATSSGMPVIARRRISKILKTGVVQKPKKKDEEEVSEGKDSDGWSSYMKEVQRYRANKCIENEASRPPLVK